VTNENLHPATETLEAYAEGALESGERAVFESHLLGCERCQAGVEEWRSLFAALESLPRFAPTTGFADRVMARVRIPQPQVAWSARALAQLRTAGQRAERWMPHTTRAWALVAAMLALPVVVAGAIVTWLLTRDYVTAEALRTAVVGTVDNGAQRLGTAVVQGAMSTDAAAWLATNLSTFVQTAGMRGLGALMGGAALLTMLSIWVLYRNLFRSTPRESSYVTYSF
jgi:hypothetical protein